MKMFFKALFCCLIMFSSCYVFSSAASNFYSPATNFNTDIISPENFLGHQLGEQMVRNDQLVAYFKMLSEQSERVSFEVIGYSHERRPIITLTISSPANLKKLPEIQQKHMLLQQGNALNTSNMPVISWINFGVHGSEVSSTDSAIPIAYHLAAAQGKETEKLLENSVILLTASMNPDGNSREASWNLRYQSEVAISDPAHALHGSPWPSGRTNHYWFDLNRQWMLQQHPEPVSWVKKFHDWRPNIVADFHEMRSYKSFYFHPGAPDRVHPLINKQAMGLLSDVVEQPRAYLDSAATLFFNEEAYDNFYLGKGATYPHLYGSLGILFEQASSAGALETPRGLLSFRENIKTYYHVGLALLNNAVDKKQALLNYQYQFSKETKETAKNDSVKGYVFSAPEDPAKIFHFLQLLSRNKIDVKPLTKDITVNGKSFSANQAYVVESAQVSYPMLKGLFSKVTRFENNTFYDVSGWTMPLAFGIEYEELKQSNYQVGDVLAVTFPRQPSPSEAQVAYAFEWSNYYAPKLMYQLLQEGFRPRVANNGFQAETDQGQKTFMRGTVVVPVSNQDKSKLHSLMSQAAEQDAIASYALQSSHTQSIGMDLGSNNIEAIEQPHVLLVIGPSISQYQAGEVWHLLDKRMNIPSVLVTKSQLEKLDLNNYSHIVLVDGQHANINKKTTDKLLTWTRSGGTFIGIADGAKWASKELLDLVTVEISPGIENQRERINYGQKSHLEAQDIIGGAVMLGDLDITHPLGYGYVRREVASHRSGLLVFEMPKNPYASIVQIAQKPLLTGFASVENQQQLAGKTSLVAQRLGKGSVILFADDPNFRGYFYGTEKLFLNSLFFSKLFVSPR